MTRLLKNLSPARIIALGFATVILLGSLLLILPCSIREGVTLNYIDALYTSTSAVCVTGLIAVDPGSTFTPLGQFFLAALIQIGGLGVTSVGAGIILAMGGKIKIKGRSLIREASNLDSGKGAIRFIKSVFFTTLAFELVGALLSFIVFVQDFPPLKAAGISIFHSIAAFNNSGFDILGLSGEVHNSISLIPYQSNLLLNLVTCGLIFFGGIGFLVIREAIEKRFHWKKFSMHSKIVISTSAVLIIIGTLLVKLTENVSWLGALFFSVSARTAGFSTYSLSTFSNAGLLIIAVLMFIGASPGSTGGGIKTSTFFSLLQGVKAAATNKSEKAFRYTIPKGTFRKAAVITMMALVIVFTGTYLLLIMESGNPDISFIDALFEMTSAFGTVGLSTGITTSLGIGSKLLSILVMYIGRLGPLTIATLWYFTKGERAEYPNGNIAIG
ncbi:MAG: potassium transporter TrkG [Clostridia bacterium]|nr:potassium transporter TrkG [Clostridia bacterium]